jgi:hypothetical protein
MNLLYNNELAPITSTIGFLKTDINTASLAFLEWQQKLIAENFNNSFSLEKREIKGHLKDSLMALLPLVSHEPRRHLFVPTKSDWVAYFNNPWRGTDADGLVSYLATKIHCQALLVTAVPDSMEDKTGLPYKTYGATVLEIHGPEYIDWQNTLRAISVMNDGGQWTFYNKGTPLPFEDTKRYEARRIQDRFTFEMLQEYLQALGLLPFEESFYMPSAHCAILIEKKGPLSPDVKEYTLAEARA